MEITAKQAAEILGVDKNTVSRMVRDGALKPVNARAEGAKKFFARFDAATVRALKKNLPKTSRGRNLRRQPAKVKSGSALTDVLAFAEFDPDQRRLLIELGKRFTAGQLDVLINL